MKKASILLFSLLLLLTGCSRGPADGDADAPQPTVTVKEAEPWTASPTDVPMLTTAPTAMQVQVDRQAKPLGDPVLGHCVSILDALPCSVDLDGDGREEIVDLVTCAPADGYPRWAVTVDKNGDVKRAETDVPEDMTHDLWVGDLDEDGAYELFFHGDLASDDYVLYAWRHDLTPLPFEPDERRVRAGDEGTSTVFDGAVEGFEDGHIIVLGAVDMLGTHWGVRTLAIGDDGVIGPVSTVWSFDEEDRPLTVTRALTAYKAAVRKDPGDAFTLQPGEKIWPLASDGCSRMWFETEQGKGGVLLLTPDEEHQWLIDGTPEAEYFEFLPYAG